MLDDVVNSLPSDPMLARRSRPSQIHAYELAILSDNITTTQLPVGSSSAKEPGESDTHAHGLRARFTKQRELLDAALAELNVDGEHDRT